MPSRLPGVEGPSAKKRCMDERCCRTARESRRLRRESGPREPRDTVRRGRHRVVSRTPVTRAPWPARRPSSHPQSSDMSPPHRAKRRRSRHRRSKALSPARRQFPKKTILRVPLKFDQMGFTSRQCLCRSVSDRVLASCGQKGVPQSPL
jgi:hypothetical protein